MISYEPLWETMRRKEISTYTLIYKLGFSPNTIHNLRHNRSVTVYTLEKLCAVLDCTPNDILEFRNDPQE